MEYESNILKRLVDTYGVVGNPRYISEIIKEFIVRGKERFPELFTYQSDWLAHIDEFGLNPTYTVSYTGQSIYAPNTLERPVKSAILKGSTKYRDIDTGEVLDAFEDGRNLELVSVKMPVLTTSNEDGTKSNILTVNEDVTLRGIGDVKDELNCLTGEVTERIGEIVLGGSENWVIENPLSNDEYIYFKLNDPNTIKSNVPTTMVVNVLTDKLKISSYVKETSTKSNSYFQAWTSHFIGISRTELSTQDVVGFKEWLSNNNIPIQYLLSEKSIKTVELTILDQNGQNVKQLMSFNDGTHFNTTSLEGSPLPVVSVSVETDLEEILMVCSLEGNTL